MTLIPIVSTQGREETRRSGVSHDFCEYEYVLRPLFELTRIVKVKAMGSRWGAILFPFTTTMVIKKMLYSNPLVNMF